MIGIIPLSKKNEYIKDKMKQRINNIGVEG